MLVRCGTLTQRELDEALDGRPTAPGKPIGTSAGGRAGLGAARGGGSRADKQKQIKESGAQESRRCAWTPTSSTSSSTWWVNSSLPAPTST
jgi:hypothetical protein